MFSYWRKVEDSFRKHYPSVRFFVPMMVFMFGGTYFLKECIQVDVERRRRRELQDRTDALVSEIRKVTKSKRKGGFMDTKEDLERTREEIVSQFNLETYDIVRGPREWEPGTTEKVQEIYVKRMSEVAERRKAEESTDAAEGET